jgi:hypothetical protein
MILFGNYAAKLRKDSFRIALLLSQLRGLLAIQQDEARLRIGAFAKRYHDASTLGDVHVDESDTDHQSPE